MSHAGPGLLWKVLRGPSGRLALAIALKTLPPAPFHIPPPPPLPLPTPHLLNQSLGIGLWAGALTLLVNLGLLLFAYVCHRNPAFYGRVLLSIHDVHLWGEGPWVEGGQGERGSDAERM